MFTTAGQPYISRLIALASRVIGSPFLRSASTLMVCTIAGQLMTVASAPVLSRFYSPADFGAFGLVVAFTSAIGVLTALNYESSLPTALDDREASAVAIGAAGITLLMSTGLGVVFFALVRYDLLSFGTLPTWSVTVVWLLLTVATVASILNYWAVRHADFGTIGESIVAQNAGRATIQILCGVLGVGWAGLAAGEIVGRMAATTRLISLRGPRLIPVAARRRPAEVIEGLRRFQRFPTVLLPAMLSDQIVSAVSIPLVTTLFGVTAAGQYFLMRRVMDMPAALVSRTISDIFYSRISAQTRRDPSAARRFVVRVSVTVLALSTVALSPLMIFGSDLFGWGLGEQWRQAGQFAAFSTPGVIVSLAASPVSRVFALTRVPALRYVFTVVNVAGLTLVFGLTHLRGLSLNWAVAALGLVSFCAYTAYIVAACMAAGALVESEGGDV